MSVWSVMLVKFKIIMKRGILSSSLRLFLGTVMGVVAAQTMVAVAADKPKAPAEEAAPKRDWYPFHGDVASVNKTANSISLKKQEGERVLRLDAKSELTRGGKKVTLADVKAGDYAHGKLHKNAKGEEVITAAGFDAGGRNSAPSVKPPAPAKDK